jgi:hypothetical protein
MAHLDLFISHSPPDDAYTTALAGALRTAGVWVSHERSALQEGRLPQATETKLRHCLAFLVILSPAALATPEVREACAWAAFQARRDPRRLLLSLMAAPMADVADWRFADEFTPIAGDPLRETAKSRCRRQKPLRPSCRRWGLGRMDRQQRLPLLLSTILSSSSGLVASSWQSNATAKRGRSSNKRSPARRSGSTLGCARRSFTRISTKALGRWKGRSWHSRCSRRAYWRMPAVPAG